MTKELKVWCLMGSSDEGADKPTLYSTYEKAKYDFDELVGDINSMYGESVCEVKGDFASYDCDNYYGSFWICELEVK